MTEELGECGRAEPSIEQLELIGAHERRMLDAADASEREQLLAQADDVVREPRRLQRRIQPAHEPSIVRRDPRWTAIRMTTLRLNAANRQEGFAADGNEVTAKRKREQPFIGKSQLAGAV